jgi:hypothetical protein
MLFMPSIGGISHHHAANTADDDLVLGCAVLAEAAQELLGAAPPATGHNTTDGVLRFAAN